MAVCAPVRSSHRRLSAIANSRCSGAARLLDFFGRIDLGSSLVRYCAGDYRISAGGKTNCTNRGTPVSILAFFFIVVSLLSFVLAQLILKRAMEFSATNGLRNSRFVSLAATGIALMTVSFFLTLGLLQRFDLSYLYPFQGLSVIFITLLAAMVLKEKLSARLTLGALLITAGIVLVSMS
ncbi:MAG: hypothetical protein DME67_00730 [Verrucomicrobia bacterium]|nr:MAG: hypothetical protein DME95_02075 [Verrucomicrobiota bacterium]PYK07406.1 MAG: hypothetical protein DME67_00730 [Verrucomicrobiota bacterium]